MNVHNDTRLTFSDCQNFGDEQKTRAWGVVQQHFRNGNKSKLFVDTCAYCASDHFPADWDVYAVDI